MKKSNYKTFNFKTIDGAELSITCYYFETSTTWGHRAYFIDENGEFQVVKINYYNRTWEAFTYESVLYKAVRAYYPQEKRQQAERAFIHKQLKAIAQHEADACEKWLKRWTKQYNALSEKTRESIKNSDVIINTIEQGENLLKVAKMMDAIDALK